MGTNSGAPLATEEALLRRHGASRLLRTRAESLGADLNRLKKIIFPSCYGLGRSGAHKEIARGRGSLLLRPRQSNPMKWFYRLFTWWHGQTLNTALYTLLFGKFVGADEFGNRYYRSRKVDKTLGVERRWVIFSGESDGSMQPPGWYGWLHHTVDEPPPLDKYAPRAWQKPFEPNLTGTPQAWRPPGSILAANARPPATGDYEAWTPES